MKITIEIERDIESNEDVLAFLTALSGVGEVASQTAIPQVKTPVNKPSEVKSAPKPKAEPKAEPVAEPKSKVEPVAEKTPKTEDVKLEELQALLADTLANKPELKVEAKAVLTDHGASRLSALKIEDYASVKAALTELRGQ